MKVTGKEVLAQIDSVSEDQEPLISDETRQELREYIDIDSNFEEYFLELAKRASRLDKLIMGLNVDLLTEYKANLIIEKLGHVYEDIGRVSSAIANAEVLFKNK
jgi:hypothetical protein